MHTFVLFDHPHEKSFCAAACGAIERGITRAGGTVDVENLYQSGFDPILRTSDLATYQEGKSSDPSVADYQRRISQADHLALVFPVWWQVMPALTKGFLDKVFLPGWAFEIGENGVSIGKLGHLRVTIVTTMGSSHTVYHADYRNPLEGMFRLGTCGFVGIPAYRVAWLNFPDIDSSTLQRRLAWLAEIESYFSSPTSH